jgi:small subunit ribosomal protein S2
MALPAYNMRQLLEAGVHFGHQSHRWNPKMQNYIFGSRNNIHIIDLAQTVPMLHQGLVAVSDAVAKGGRVLFVGTKRQASDAIADAAKRCAQYYINRRWLGGTLTNWKTVSQSIRRLKQLDELLAAGAQGLTKKEQLNLTRERDKLDIALGGIKDMGGLPDVIFVIDTNKEAIAIAEAKKLGIPVIGIVDSNSNPDNINFPIPGNDDAGRAISLYCDLFARAAIDGIDRAQGGQGHDAGEAVDPHIGELPEEGAVAGAKANGKPAASKTGAVYKGLDAPVGLADDLKRINGISLKIETKLNDLGLYHFWQMAKLTPEEVNAIDNALKSRGRVAKEDWVGQAKKLQAETEETN